MIIINARFLTQPITGVQRFAIELSKILKERLKERVHFVTCPGVIHEELFTNLDAKVIGFNKSHLWEQMDLYMYLIRHDNPLLVSFGYTGPLFYSNQIVSVHDVAFKYYRETFSKSFALVYNYLVPKVANRSLHVFTVSEAAKVEVCKELRLEDKKVSVIYNGISPVFKSVRKIPLKEPLQKPYILTVSSHHPRKNYERLIKAFHKLGDESLELFVVGNLVSHFSGRKELESNRNVKFLTNVSDEELISYYQNALLFVFPSLYEGFGIPVIEAMSQNLPCVLSDIPVFKEIGDDSVIYVDPKEVDSISQGIRRGIDCENQRFVYPKLEKFTWENSANKVIKVIESFI